MIVYIGDYMILDDISAYVSFIKRIGITCREIKNPKIPPHECGHKLEVSPISRQTQTFSVLFGRPTRTVGICGLYAEHYKHVACLTLHARLQLCLTVALLPASRL